MPNPIRTRRRLPLGGYPNLAGDFSGTKSASIVDNASLSMGAGLDMSVAAWMWLNANGASMNGVSKANVSGQYEWLLWFAAASTFRFQVSANGTTFTIVNATLFGLPPVNTWNFVVATYDGTNISVSVNAGTQNQTAFSTDVFNGTDAFTLGRADAGLPNMNGRQDCPAFWKSARGAGGALSTAKIAKLYKAGVGMAYRDLDSDLKTGLVSWYNLDGDLQDSHGTNHLTNNNSLGFASGKR